MDIPKHHELEGEDGPDGKEIVLKHYNIEGSWNFGIKESSLFITNHRLIYESFDGIDTKFIEHEVVDCAKGSNSGGFFGRSGILTLCFRDGITQERIPCGVGGDIANYLNSTIYTWKAKENRKIAAAKLIKKEKLLQAKKHEKLLEFDEAASIYKELGMDDDTIRVRKLKAEQGAVKVSQKVVHGDEVTKTEIKDSVVSKSNIGSGGDDKLTKIKELKELHDAGAIDDDEFKQMKKEILGK